MSLSRLLFEKPDDSFTAGIHSYRSIRRGPLGNLPELEYILHWGINSKSSLLPIRRQNPLDDSASICSRDFVFIY